MVFSSAIFLFAFLPAVFLLYRVIPAIKSKNVLLLIASLVFYSFGQLAYLPLFLFSIVCNYIAGRLLGSAKKHRRFILTASVIINLGVLCVFKYTDFLIGILNAVTGLSVPLPGITLPIGISFFTFQGMSYVIDAYREPSLSSRNFIKLALYISLFPQLIAGPIIIYHDVAAQIDSRACTPSLTAAGIRRFISGLAKKLLIANTVGAVVDQVYALSPDKLDFRLAWIAAVFYALQIYFDFSGYSDMAIGMGKMFGFSFMENFDYPYISGSIKEFWRRWHISLSSWFRSYLYIPLGGNRKGKARTVVNKLIVFFCTGLWHGASWNFVIWGLWNGLFMILEDLVPAIGKIPKVIRHTAVLLITISGFVVFRAENLASAGSVFRSMFTFNLSPYASNLLSTFTVPLIVSVIGMFAATPVLPKCRAFLQSRGGAMASAAQAASYASSLLLLFLCFLNLSSTSFNPFIYFQF